MRNRIRFSTSSSTYRTIVSVAFGMLGLAANFANIHLFHSPNFEVTILLGLIFPLIIALAWGWKYGLISALAGGCQSMWWLWSNDGWGLLYSVPVFTLWVAWHGWWADRRRVRKSWHNSPFIVEIPFRIAMELGFYTIFRFLVSLNPPPWNANILWRSVPLSWVNTVAIKHLLSGYILLLAAYVILDLGPVRRFFGLRIGSLQRKVAAIYAGGVLIGLFLWAVDSAVEFLAFSHGRSFWEVAVLNVEQHELFMRTLYIIFSLILASAMVHLSMHRALLRERVDHLNLLLYAIRNVNQIIVKEKNREQLLSKACDQLVETRDYFSAWAAVLAPSKKLEFAVESGLGEAFAPILERLQRGEIPACAREAMDSPEVVVIPDPEGDCTGYQRTSTCTERFGAAVRLAYGDRVFGFLVLSLPGEYARDDEERSLLLEVTGDLGLALHNIEVERERKRTEERYKLIVENAHSGIIIIDDQYHLQWVNDRICQILMAPKDEIIGHDFREFLDDESLQFVADRYVRRQRAEDVSSQYEFNVVRKDGSKRRVEIHSNVIRNSSGRMMTISQLLDITELVNAQERLRDENRMILALSRSAAAIVSSLDMHEVFERILDELQRVVQADAASLMLIEGDVVRVVDARAYNPSIGGYNVIGRRFVLADIPILHRLMESKRPVVIADIGADPTWVQVDGEEWQRSYAGVPIFMRDRAIGFLNIDRAFVGEFDNKTIERLQVFASIAGAVIENATLINETRLHAERSELLSKMGHDLASTLDLHAIYCTAYNYVKQLVDCANFTISLFNAQTETLQAVFVLSDGREIDVSQLPPLKNPLDVKTGRAGAVNLRRALIVDDLAEKAKKSKETAHVGSDKEPQSAIYVPMIAEDCVIGLLEIQSHERHAYSEDDVSMLSMAANQVAFAVNNASLFAQISDLKTFNERIVTSLSEGIVLENASTVITYINHATTEMLGYSQDEIIGKKWLSIVPESERETIAAKMEGRRAGKSERYETLLLTKSGDELPVIMSARPLFDGDSFSGVLSVVTDIRVRKEAEERTNRAFEGAIEALELTTESRDAYTAGHQRRVTLLAVAIAQKMVLPEDKIEGLRIASLVHDIGKIAIPAEILSKPTRLSELEMEIIRTHPQLAYDILKGIDFPWPIADIVLQHHERLDGSGYPRGLKGEEIMLEARILAVSDVVEAMSSHRPYRPACGTDAALREVIEHKGIEYDSAVVDACIAAFEDGFTFE